MYLTKLAKLLIGGCSTLLAMFLSWLLFLNHVDINEIGVAYNSSNGTISTQSPGWHITPPWVRATTITLLPIRVELSLNSRFILPKIVQFQPEFVEEFIKVQGFGYFETKSVLAQYAFSGKEWPFLKEIK